MNGDALVNKALTITDKVICVAISLLLVASSTFLSPVPAYAVSDADIQAAEDKYNDSALALEEAKAKIDAITEEYNALSAEIDSLQIEIDKAANSVLESQNAMLEGRSVLSNTAVYEYRSSTVSTILNTIFGSSNMTELFKNMDYIQNIMQQQAEEVEKQKHLKDEFTQASEKLTLQKNEQDAKFEELSKKREEAAAVVEQASATVEEDSAELEELKKKAESFIWKTSPAVDEDPDANTTDRKDPISDNTPVVPDPSPPSGDWITGVASAYGGDSDPYTPCPGKTATGAICDNNSMGVAVPQSLPNYTSYYGKTVEIRYNGMTVYGVVNDCGYMSGGARALDLQPGIFKAFGYEDCLSWGLRTVSYRFY